MANLIITIISIALVAVAALMGAFYAGQAFLGGSDKAKAAQLLVQNSQILGAANLYMLAHGYSQFRSCSAASGYSYCFTEDDLALEGYTQGRIPILNATTGTLYNISDPALIANYARGSGAYDGPYTYKRALCPISGKNVIFYGFYDSGTNFSTATTTHPLVRLCLAINANATFPPGTTFAANGIPFASGSYAYTNQCANGQLGPYDGSGYNYCYMQSVDGVADQPTALLMVFDR